jgi:hypothetical protein
LTDDADAVAPRRRRLLPAAGADDVHVPFVVASLLFGLLGGLSLAVTLPIQALLGRVDVSWVAHAQVHGHAQAIGFAGLFVVGVALRLVPRFGGRRDLRYARAVPWLFCLLVGGVLGRMLGQPVAGEPLFRLIGLAGLVAEIAGAALYLAVIAGTLSSALHARQATAVLITASAAALLVQAVLGLWWAGAALLEGRTIVAAAESRTLVHLQLFGFLLLVILGVGMRSFPTFFGRQAPSQAAGMRVAVASVGGVVVWTLGTALPVAGVDGWRVALAGQFLTGLGIFAAIAAFGPWKKASRLAAASKGLAWAIHPALLWLATTGVLLAGTAAVAALHGRALSSGTLDAIRHVFAVGVVTLAIVGMAQLILPEFASERLVRTVGAWRGPFFGVAFSVAALLRGIAPLGVEGEGHWWLLTVAGVITWVALAAFSVLAWRALRSHRAYVQRINRFKRDALPTA